MKKIIILLFIKIVLAGIIAISVLSVFTIFYHYEGIHISNVGNGTDYKWEAKQLKSQMTEGFSWFFMDSNGFNNYKVVENPDILLMGSSHMEGCEVKTTENTAFILNQNTNLTVYNIGVSGHTIYRLVDNLNDALTSFKPKSYVVLETDTIKLDMDDMESVIDGKAQPIPSYDSGIIYYMQKIPAVKLMYSQIRNWISNQSDKSAKSSSEDLEKYNQVINLFIGKIYNESMAKGVTPIIFYQPPTKLNQDGTLNLQTDEKYLNAFKSACVDNNVIFIDLTEEFSLLYYNEHILAHGFGNTAVGVGHLNKFGHLAIASKLTEVINSLEDKKS